jgi:hypothetical protein
MEYLNRAVRHRFFFSVLCSHLIRKYNHGSKGNDFNTLGRRTISKTILLKNASHARFRAVTAMTMKSYIFWDVMPYSLVEVYQSFGETYCFHLQVRLLLACTEYSSTLETEAVCSSKTSVKLLPDCTGVISQMVVVFNVSNIVK